MTTGNKPLTEEAGRLLLRFAVGGLMLFHGINKIRHGVDYMFPLLEAKGLPPSSPMGRTSASWWPRSSSSRAF
jgi:hypothetical protein